MLLRVRSKVIMDRGSDLSWLSAFPGEKEFLYPPITFLRPLRPEADSFTIGSAVYSVIDVEARC